jgi:hypothetical protein
MRLPHLNGKKICMIPSAVNTQSYQSNRVFIRAKRKLIATVDMPAKDAVFEIKRRGARA